LLVRGNYGTTFIGPACIAFRQRSNYSEALKFTAKKPPAEDAASRLGEHC
jgi:hypothetical protein